MKKTAFLLLILLIALTVLGTAQAQGVTSGISVTCDNGARFDNGVEFVVNQMRPGFNYTATAIGLNGFDPVLAVLDASGNGLCADDTAEAASATAALPSTGRVPASGLTSRIQFAQTASEMADVSLVVGGFGNTSGEFLLILEGMVATSSDGAGDPFSVQLSPNLIESGVPLSVYMISVTTALDPYMFLADENFNTAVDNAGNPIFCDDGGDADLCWGENTSLAGSVVSRAGGHADLGGGQYDAMLQMPLQGYASLDPAEGPWYLTFVMTSYQQKTFGDYVIAFHAGTGSSEEDTGKIGGTQPEPTPTSAPSQQSAETGTGGISVTCEDGNSFDNGVEFVVNQMRPGFNYTATAIGIGGFDPVLAVLDANGNGLCADDTAEAASYTANLPSTGRLPASGLSPQIHFSQTAGQMADVSLVVGGFGNTTGQFLLILEGMVATSSDGAGDPFSIRLTPGLTSSDIPLSVYMLSVTTALDPYMFLSDGNLNAATDDDGNSIFCDDAGSADLCWGENSSLAGSSVSRTQNRTLGGGQYDAMLQVPLQDFSALDFDAGPWYLTFVMTSYQQTTFGDYVIAFHAEAR